MKTVVQKWGNSLGIRIPSPFVKELNLKSGNSVDVTEKDGVIVIAPVQKDLTEMVSNITPDNLHAPVETGTPVGNEEW